MLSLCVSRPNIMHKNWFQQLKSRIPYVSFHRKEPMVAPEEDFVHGLFKVRNGLESGVVSKMKKS